MRWENNASLWRFPRDQSLGAGETSPDNGPMPPTPNKASASTGLTEMIFVLRGQRVIADEQLASLYGVSTRRLNEQVKRNLARFPEDFMFRLNSDETAAVMRSQIATASPTRRNARFTPYVFTEHGAIMAATVLNSAKAIEMSLFVVRAFVQLRQLISENEVLARRLKQIESNLEARLISHDRAIAEILGAIRMLTGMPPRKKRGIGFTADIDGQS